MPPQPLQPLDDSPAETPLAMARPAGRGRRCMLETPDRCGCGCVVLAADIVICLQVWYLPYCDVGIGEVSSARNYDRPRTSAHISDIRLPLCYSQEQSSVLQAAWHLMWFRTARAFVRLPVTTI
eukprot:753197-Pelagomonas_calceolata.AAC.3